ncbi:MAG: EAL domain-containing protein [Pseudomonadota bacterium]
MDIIFQFYGLWFLLPGLLILVWPKHESEYGFAKILWLLGAFGVTQGLIEWIQAWRQAQATAPLSDIIEPWLLLASCLFLFEFGRRLLRSCLTAESLAALPGRIFSPWVYVFLLGGIAYAGQAADRNPHETLLGAYRLAGLIGAVLTGSGFFLYWHRRIKLPADDPDYRRVKAAFHMLAAAFIGYGVLGGLAGSASVSLAAAELPGPALSEALSLPAQIAMTLVAVLAAVSIVYILRLFDNESRKRFKVLRASSEQHEKSLSRTSRHYEVLLHTASDGIHVLNTDGDIVEVNEAFCRMLGYSREQMLGMNVAAWDTHFSPEELKVRVPMLIGKLTMFESSNRRSDGRIIDVEISTVGVTIDGQTLLYCSSRDITHRKHAEEQLRLVARVFDRAAEGVMITDENQKILTVNDAFTTVTGYPREEVIGKTPAILQSGKQAPDFYKNMWTDLRANGWWQGEIWNRRKNGELYLEWLSINSVVDEAGKVINYIGMFSDITLIKESRQRMEFLATHDELTDLPNRTLFKDHLRLALARSARAGGRLALLFVDLDNFKMINDTLGHQEGDALLKQVAVRLKGCIREVDSVARLGGDEFVVLLEIEHRNDAAIMAKRILEAFSANFLLQEQECYISPSIGISLFPEDGPDPLVLMRHADTAMYRAKERGKNTFMFFTTDMAEQISRRMTIENALRQGLANQDFILEYQPQISLVDGSMAGVEALLRWHYHGNILPPREFIQIAEESGLIVDIDEWVLDEVCRQMRVWDESGLPPFWVSINLSARHFRRPDIVVRLTNIVAASRISPERLCLEITEGVLMDVESASHMLNKLNEAGFRISVDDFGTGFSSLSYLKRLPIHEVKVDRSFVDGIASDADDRAITTAIIAMARGLGLRTVAEGVETQVQETELKRLRCDFGQGYLYSKPLSAASLKDWVLARRK